MFDDKKDFSDTTSRYTNVWELRKIPNPCCECLQEEEQQKLGIVSSKFGRT